jgi:hypothetical protein
VQDQAEDPNDSQSPMRENFDNAHTDYSLKERLVVVNQGFVEDSIQLWLVCASLAYI